MQAWYGVLSRNKNGEGTPYYLAGPGKCVWFSGPQAHRESYRFLLHCGAFPYTHQTVLQPVQYAYHHNMATTGSRYAHGMQHFSTSPRAGNGDDSERRRVFFKKSWDLKECGTDNDESIHGHHQPHKRCRGDSKAVAVDERTDCPGHMAFKLQKSRSLSLCKGIVKLQQFQIAGE